MGRGTTLEIVGEAVRDTRLRVAVPLALALVLSLFALTAGPASGARLTSSKAKQAVVSYVKHRWGSSYAVHPACYSLSSRRSKCFVHMVHNSSSCTKYATVTLKGRRTAVSMAKPSC
jgi:hypothetical protein